MKAFITGLGWVTPNSMGCGRDHGHFEWKAGKLPEIKRRAVFEKPFPHFGRLDRFCRLGLGAIAFALRDAGLDRWEHKRPIGIVASTVYGCLDTDINYLNTVLPEEGRLASPNLFAYTLPNSYLGEAAIHFGLTGPSFMISEPMGSELWCIRLGLSAMAEGQIDTVLSGMGDHNIPEPYADTRGTAFGALFFVIQKSVAENQAAYGQLHLQRDGRLTFDGCEIKSMALLAHLCVAAMARSKEALKIHRGQKYSALESYENGSGAGRRSEQNVNQTAL